MMDRDLGVMIDGFQALIWLNDHSEDIGIGGCQGCSKFAAALFRGSQPADVLHLRCSVAQMMQRQVDAADKTWRRLCP